MSKRYEAPVVVTLPGTAEGVYASSGDTVAVSRTCESIYRRGVYQEPHGNTGRVRVGESTTGAICGCQGCCADVNYQCIADERVSWAQPLKPGWEREGHSDTETFVYSASMDQ